MVPIDSVSIGAYTLRDHLECHLTKAKPELFFLPSSVDLHDALKAVALSESLPGSPVNIRVSSRVKSCDCEKGIVRLDSGEEIQADLIIGADGM